MMTTANVLCMYVCMPLGCFVHLVSFYPRLQPFLYRSSRCKQSNEEVIFTFIMLVRMYKWLLYHRKAISYKVLDEPIKYKLNLKTDNEN